MLAAGVVTETFAAPWTIDRGVSVREVYTDNVGLDPDGEARSDLATEITPRFSIRKADDTGRGRIDFNFDYSLQTFTLGGEQPESFRQQLQGNLEAEIVKQIFFVDARTTIGQQSVSNARSVSDSNVSSTGNVTTTSTYSVSPYVRHHLKRYADSEFRITVDGVLVSDVDNADSTSTRFNTNVTSGRYFARMPWRVNYSRQKIDNDGRSETSLQRIEGQLRYVINRRYSVGYTAGYDINDFASSQSRSGGFRWRTEFFWNPSPRTSAQVGYGSQFSGDSISYSVSHRRRRSIFRASFEEDTTTVRQQQLERVLVPLVDEFGDPITDPGTGAPLLIPVNLPSLNDEVIVSRRFTASAAVRHRRTTTSVQLFSTLREFQVSDDEETVFGGSFRLNRRLTRRSSGSFTGRWQQSELARGTREDQRWDVGVSYTQRFGQGLSASADYRHFEQTSDLAANEFRENRFSVRLDMLF